MTETLLATIAVLQLALLGVNVYALRRQIVKKPPTFGPHGPVR